MTNKAYVWNAAPTTVTAANVWLWRPDGSAWRRVLAEPEVLLKWGQVFVMGAEVEEPAKTLEWLEIEPVKEMPKPVELLPLYTWFGPAQDAPCKYWYWNQSEDEWVPTSHRVEPFETFVLFADCPREPPEDITCFKKTETVSEWPSPVKEKTVEPVNSDSALAGRQKAQILTYIREADNDVSGGPGNFVVDDFPLEFPLRIESTRVPELLAQLVEAGELEKVECWRRKV